MINFLKYRFLYLAISLSVLIPGTISLVMWGLNPSIDFVGGTVIEMRVTNYDLPEIGQALDANNISVVSLQNNGDGQLVIRTKPIDREMWNTVLLSLNKENATADVVRFETVGPVLGKELLIKTMYAAIIALFGILLYVAWAFKDIRYGISALIALFHDVLVVAGIFSLLGHFFHVEVDVLFVTALLTTMSFSVHDTIVVFDRIREHRKKDDYPLDVIINMALTETMTRSINNSLTIIFMLLSLVLLGGDSIRWFVVALLIGTISGTYSSPFVATPILYSLLKKKQKE